MLYEIIIFIFGLSVGSFLNAVIWRLETGESVVQSFPEKRSRGVSPRTFLGELARSHCPHCKTTLYWYDLVPVFSFVFLKGKCRHCGGKISIQYPIVEIATGILFMFVFWKIWMPKLVLEGVGFYPEQVLASIYWLYISSSLIIIFVYDLKHYIIPDKILFPAIIISFLYRIYEALNSFLSRHAEPFGLAQGWLVSASHGTLKQIQGDELWAIEKWQGIILYILAAVLVSGLFLALVLVSRGKWMGLGDVKLAFLMGLVLGWPNIAVALFFAFMGGAVVGLTLIFSNSMFSREPFSGFPENGSRERHYTLKSQIPFGPFLIIGTFVALFWGPRIVDWYLRLLF